MTCSDVEAFVLHLQTHFLLFLRMVPSFKSANTFYLSRRPLVCLNFFNGCVTVGTADFVSCFFETKFRRKTFG